MRIYIDLKNVLYRVDDVESSSLKAVNNTKKLQKKFNITVSSLEIPATLIRMGTHLNYCIFTKKWFMI